MTIRAATPDDAAGIMVIFNHAILQTTAIWSETVVDEESRRAVIAERRRQGYPMLVAIEDDRVVGYATFGDFRASPGYRYTVEHSVYIHPDYQGRGFGRALMEALIPRARALGKHIMIAGIGADNAASIALHASLGFVETARMPQVGAKFGQWQDLVLMQLRLDEREGPEG